MKSNLIIGRERIAALKQAISEGLPDTCILYAPKQWKHYQMGTREKRVGVHRYAYSLYHGVELSSETIICHTCDTPACWNPKHLFAGTQSDNIRDCVSKGRHKGVPPLLRGSENGSSKLTEDQVREIRCARAEGQTYMRLGAHYGVSGTMIRDIVLRKKWRAVD